MTYRLLAAIIALEFTVVSQGAEEVWRRVPDAESAMLIEVAESALESQWERSRRGWCRAIQESNGDRQQFTLWWDDDKTGLDVESIMLGEDRDPRIRAPIPRLALYLPKEQWIFAPTLQQCNGFGGKHAQRLPRELEVHPHKFWLAMFDGQKPEFTHLNRMRASRAVDDRLRTSRNDAGHVCFDTRQMRLVFDLQRDFSPIRAEFQTKLDEDSHPELLLPTREDYELAQDRHGHWYCKQMVRTSWPRGGNGESWRFQSPTIVEYDSEPELPLLRLSFKSLKLPVGTNVQSRTASGSKSWIVGQEKEGEKVLTEQRFRELGETLRVRGFAKKEAP